MYCRVRTAALTVPLALGCSLLLLAGGSPSAARSDDDTPFANLGKAISQLDLKDTAGKTWTLADLKDKKAVVVVFLGTQCPINNAYLPRLAELHKTYAAKGVQFLAINANKQDTPEKIAAHVKEFSIPFPVLRDNHYQATDLFGARRTPETFVLDAKLQIRYHGRIDDQFGVGYQRAEPNRQDLILALDEVLAGKPVTKASTAVAGCLIGRTTKQPAASPSQAAITYTKQVSRIVQNRCQECHRAGQIGPMPLMTYDDVASWSDMIREVVSDKRMPPWHADPKHHGQFRNERALSKEEYDTLLKWIDLGCPRGDDSDLPPAKQFAGDWLIGRPDVVLEMPQEYKVPAKAPKNGVKYQYFAIKTNFAEDKWIQSAECKPGNRAVVHHIIALNPSARSGDGADGLGGLGAAMLAAYAPGDLGITYPPGVAKKLPKGTTIYLQVHYTPNGVECTDKSSVGLIFAKEPPKMEAKSKAISNYSFAIKPGAASHEVRSEATFKQDTIVYGLLPHMHLRGKDFKYDVVYPDGKTETILWVPRYDFGWQSTYHFKEPLRLPAGSKIKCLAHFDNSANNPWNPDPTATVRFGEQTWEEMMIGFLDYASVDGTK
jgi:peroxiredoxin